MKYKAKIQVPWFPLANKRIDEFKEKFSKPKSHKTELLDLVSNSNINITPFFYESLVKLATKWEEE